MTAVTANEVDFSAGSNDPRARRAPAHGPRRGLKAQLVAYALYVVGIAAALLAL